MEFLGILESEMTNFDKNTMAEEFINLEVAEEQGLNFLISGGEFVVCGIISYCKTKMMILSKERVCRYIMLLRTST